MIHYRLADHKFGVMYPWKYIGLFDLNVVDCMNVELYVAFVFKGFYAC